MMDENPNLKIVLFAFRTFFPVIQKTGIAFFTDVRSINIVPAEYVVIICPVQKSPAVYIGGGGTIVIRFDSWIRISVQGSSTFVKSNLFIS